MRFGVGRLTVGLAIVLAALCGLSPASAEEGEPSGSAYTLSGRVSDAAGKGIAAVEVWISPEGRMTLTDSEGRYRLAGLRAGPYTLAFRRLGYESVSREVVVKGDDTLDVPLAIAPFTLEPIVVTSEPASIPPRESPQAVSELGGEDLRRNQTVSLAHAIEALPGVHNLSTGEQVGKPVIRGLTGPRVLVLDDTQRLEDYSWSDEDGPSIDARLVDRVEVIRGPASVLYGSDALGGVVNAVPRPLPEAPEGGSVMRGGLEVYGASNNTEGGGALRIEGAQGGLGWRVYGVGRGSGDLRTPLGKLHNTGFLSFAGEGAVGVRGEPGTLELRIAHYGGEFKLLEKEGPANEAEEGGPERKLMDDRVQLTGSTLLSGIRLEARTQWQRHNLIEVADDPNPLPGEPKESEQFNLLLNTGTITLSGTHERGRFTSTLGVSGLAQSNDTRGKVPLVPDAHVTSGGVFGYERIGLGPQWSVTASARGDFHHIDTDGNDVLHIPADSRDDSPFSAGVGAVYAPRPELSFGVNFGRGWRSPTLAELYSNGPHLGELRFEVGNPNLEPETSSDFDARVRWESPRLSCQVAGFANQVHDFIYITPTNNFQDSLRVFVHNQADAMLAGGELGVQYEVVHNVLLRGRFDYVWGQNEEIDSPLPLIPPAHGTIGARASWTDFSWTSNLMLGAEVELVAEQTRLSEFDTPTAAYSLFNLEGGLAQRWGGRPVQIDVELRNIADTGYRDYLSRYKEFALDPGRNLLVRLSTGL